MEFSKLGSVTLLGICEAVHWTLSEEEAKHSTDVPTIKLVACIPANEVCGFRDFISFTFHCQKEALTFQLQEVH